MERQRYTVGAFTSSRFIVSALTMLTMEHEAVDLSLLLNNGLLGLTQTIFRVAGVWGWGCSGGVAARVRVCTCVCLKWVESA